MASYSESTSEYLLARARQRDAEAWKTILELYTPLLRHWGVKWGLQKSDVEDLTQHVYLSAFKSLADFERNGRGSFRSWIFAIARNYLADSIRSKGEPLTAEVVARISDTEETTEEFRILFDQCMNLIQSNFRERDLNIVREYVMHNRTAKDLALEFGVKPATIRVTAKRVLDFTRQQFSDVMTLGALRFIKMHQDRE
jgi:RNA polymerase sigma-70 factor (ECF subfamily)